MSPGIRTISIQVMAFSLAFSISLDEFFVSVNYSFVAP